MQVPCRQVPELAANPISYHRLADAAIHDESNPRRLIGVRPYGEVPDK